MGRRVWVPTIVLGALLFWGLETHGAPFFKPDVPDFYQHQQSGSDPAQPFNMPELAPADPPIVMQGGMERLMPGFTNGNWWEDGGGWCCVTAFVNSFYFLDRHGFRGLFDGDPTKPWQERMAFAIEDLAIGLLGLVPDGGDPTVRGRGRGATSPIP